MQCFEVSINGKRVCRAGNPQGHNLAVDISRGGAWQMPAIVVSGDLYADFGWYEHQVWGTQRLNVGDEVTVRVMDDETADEPIERHRIDYEETKRGLTRRPRSNVLQRAVDHLLQRTSSGVEKEPPRYCSFCGKAPEEVRAMISGPAVFICNECVRLCVDIMNEPPGRERLELRDDVVAKREGEVLRGRWPERKKNDP
jgi:hypothetical protein